MSKVQVVVPCYNYGRYLNACVRSIIDQSEVSVDVLIIDDCSTDNTPEVCRQLTQLDRRVKVIRHESNKGHIQTYNEGIALVRSDYFVLLSADDLLTPGALARAVRLMDANPSVGLVYGQPICFYGDVPPVPRTSDTGWSIWPGKKWLRLVCESGKNFITSPEAIVRTSVQHKIGGYSLGLPHSADMEMWLRIAAVSDVGRVQGADQAYYRVHSSSMQRTIHSGLLFDLTGRQEAFASAFEKEAGRLADAKALHTMAKKALCAIAIHQARNICDSTDNEAAAMEELRKFALSLDPDISKTRRWRAMERAGRKDAGAMSRVFAQQTTLLRRFFHREIVDRLEWRLARRTGIFPFAR